MFAWMNAEALAAHVRDALGHFWSRSRGKLWKKGEESGNLLRVIEVRTDCDQDVVWLKVDRRRRRPRLPHRRALLLLPLAAARRAGLTRPPDCGALILYWAPELSQPHGWREHLPAAAWHASKPAVNASVAVT